jgi:hypothetical protein
LNSDEGVLFGLEPLKRADPKRLGIEKGDPSESEEYDFKAMLGGDRRVKSQVKGTFILRRKGRFYKVITARHTGGNWWTFECKDLETKQSHELRYEMLGMFDAMDAAASKLKDPKDILLLDLDNQGKWKVMTKDQIVKFLKGH